MKMRIVIIALSLCCLACKKESAENPGQEKKESGTEMVFDKTKWRIKSDEAYAYRDKMLHDLMDNQKLKHIKRDEIITMLGTPDRTDSLYLFYTVRQKRMLFFPLHTKSLVIKLKENDSVEWVKTHE